MQIEDLQRVYSLLENVTPLKFDCGKLCGSACCKDNVFSDDSEGMLLLPFEKQYLYDKGFEIKDTPDASFALCKGKCDRRYRPFMCRIFPYYIRIKQNGQSLKLNVLTDPRAISFCPVAKRLRGTRTNILFKRNILKCARILLKDKNTKAHLLKTSEECDAIYELYKKLL